MECVCVCFVSRALLVSEHFINIVFRRAKVNDIKKIDDSFIRSESPFFGRVFTRLVFHNISTEFFWVHGSEAQR